MLEQWLPIDNHPGYKVSNLGNVKSVDRLVNTVRGVRRYKGRPLSTTVEKTNRGKASYSKVSLGRGSKTKKWVHRLVATAFLPKPDGKTQVDHIDGNGLNNRVDNLRWVSQSENILNKNTLYKHSGVKMINGKPMATISRELGDKKGHIVHKRLSRGWCVKCATTIPHTGIGGDRRKPMCQHR